MSMQSIIKSVKRRWLRAVESHYVMSTETENEIARAAHKNAAYFHKQAALARSKLAALR